MAIAGYDHPISASSLIAMIMASHYHRLSTSLLFEMTRAGHCHPPSASGNSLMAIMAAGHHHFLAPSICMLFDVPLPPSTLYKLAPCSLRWQSWLVIATLYQLAL
jgi:hypothetical protein